MMARFFIERPILANVIALVIVLLGGIAAYQLPITQYPPITPPTVSVSARYPGASATILIDKVARPIEQAVNGVEDMLYMSSTSTNDGNYTLTVTFEVGTDLDQAQVLVQNRVSTAMAQLPGPVQQLGVDTQKKSTSILQIIALTSENDDFDALFLSNFATLELEDELARIPGVGDVRVFGIGEYGMRIWLDPEKLKERSLTPSDVIRVIQQQSRDVGAGQLGMPPAPGGQGVQLTVNIDASLTEVAEFEELIVKSQSADGAGALTRLKDVARVELGAQTYSQYFTMNGKPAGGVAIFQLPGSNALDTANAVSAKMDDLASRFPKGLDYTIPFDTTIFVKRSVDEVYTTLYEAGALVLIVIVMFLQSWRAVLIPATTVPVTIIGAFAAMALLGFSTNTLTLFAIVLAIGIVVDDAIVVVEGATQYIEKGRSPKQAAIDAMRDLFGPIIGITLVLMSVFLPAAFMPGITGQMYQQFALVIAATALISALNALTLKPTQCALWLKAQDPEKAAKKKNFIFRGFNWIYERFERTYLGVIRIMARRPVIMAVVGGILILLSAWGLGRVPTGFIPTEDQGYLVTAVVLPDGASLERTQSATRDIVDRCKAIPGVKDVIVIGGVSPLDGNASLANGATVYITLVDWSERGKDQDLRSIFETITERLSDTGDANCLVLVPPPIQGLGLSGGFQLEIQLTDGTNDYTRLQQVADEVARKTADRPEILRSVSSFRGEVPQLSLEIDRAKAETLAVPVGSVFDTLQSYLGSTYVNQFNHLGRNFDVFVQAEGAQRATVDDIASYNIRNERGEMVPIGTLAKVTEDRGPAIASLYNLYPSASINGAAQRGYSSGQIMSIVAGVADSVVPPEMRYEWTAMSYQENLVGNSVYYIFGLGILLVYFVLAGQYESWLIPAGVVFAIPLALLGTVAALLGLGVANNIYVQIGLVLLIAMAAKNAILVVEVAREKRAAGEDIYDAVMAAVTVRFRPIIMTSVTFILGVLPLIMASGPGASARKSIGIAVASGMLASTFIAINFVPVFYICLQRIEERFFPKKSEESSSE